MMGLGLPAFKKTGPDIETPNASRGRGMERGYPSPQ